MNRRRFLTSATQASLGATVATATAHAQTTGDKATAQELHAHLPPALVGPEAEAEYFTEARMHEALGTEELARPKVQVIAYNFPSWHPSPWMEARFGKGWTEFDPLRNARPLFPGHTMPHYPLWGYYNEAEPAWAAREIDLAVNYGVDAWLIDWYWHEGTQFYHEQLKEGMLKASNRDKLKFAVMWANHDWKNVYPARSPSQAATMLPQTHSIADLERVTDYCAEHYFSRPNYLRIGDAPLFAFFDFGKLLEQLKADGLKHGLDRMRERARKLGFAKLHIQVCNGYNGHTPLQEYGFDSAAQYGTFGWTYGGKPPGSRIPYGVGAVEAIQSWKQLYSGMKIPFHPCAQVGWDDSPRFEEFAAIAINRSPDQFERLVRAARHMTADQKYEKLVYIAAWNEWTEDHVLLPDTTWGYSYLEALKRAVGDR